jgi:glutathionylspermidine synthase
VINENPGVYNEFSKEQYVYQNVAAFGHDEVGRHYQAGVFITDGVPSGLGFRRTATENPYEIITTNHELCGHIII